MKRTELKRKTQLRRGNPLRRISKKRLALKRRMDPERKAYVEQFKCQCCQQRRAEDRHENFFATTQESWVKCAEEREQDETSRTGDKPR